MSSARALLQAHALLTLFALLVPPAVEAFAHSISLRPSRGARFSAASCNVEGGAVLWVGRITMSAAHRCLDDIRTTTERVTSLAKQVSIDEGALSRLARFSLAFLPPLPLVVHLPPVTLSLSPTLSRLCPSPSFQKMPFTLHLPISLTTETVPLNLKSSLLLCLAKSNIATAAKGSAKIQWDKETHYWDGQDLTVNHLLLRFPAHPKFHTTINFYECPALARLRSRDPMKYFSLCPFNHEITSTVTLKSEPGPVSPRPRRAQLLLLAVRGGMGVRRPRKGAA